jgi:hypothetical protein
LVWLVRPDWVVGPVLVSVVRRDLVPAWVPEPV